LDDPAWNTPGLLQDYKQNLRLHMSDPVTKNLLIADIEHVLDLQGGADRHIIVVSPNDPSLIGQTLAEVAEANGKTPVQQLVDFAMHGDAELRSGVMFRPVAGHAFDVENYMQQEYTATSTDGGVTLRVRPGQHPRYFGSYPRKIAHYTRDRGVITLPFAIRSSTGLPAQIIGLRDRGLLREGYRADLVIFDYDDIEDRTTILEPGTYPSGMHYVMVNGQWTLDRGELTRELPGQVLLR
jgi:N-acyl-D-amino-acid deacylase